MIKKTFFLFALSSALIACNGTKTESEDSDHSMEMHDHNADHNHDAESADESSLPSKEVRTAPSEGATVLFENIEDGAELSSPVKVIMGVTGMTIEPAGEIMMGAGHHHILINNELGYIPQGDIVPMDENNIHFGKGQTETNLELEPGNYKLSLQFANGFHESYGEQMSTSINIVVN